MTDHPAKPPRFPYVAALLCAGCIGAATWTWMMYSYASDVLLADCWTEGDPAKWLLEPGRVFVDADEPRRAIRWNRLMNHRYVSVRGVFEHIESRSAFLTGCLGVVGDPSDLLKHIKVLLPRKRDDLRDRDIVVLRGRILPDDEYPRGGLVRRECGRGPILDTAASRFTGASIAGLVVGAMGVFVFTVALRHWLGAQTKFREEARA